MCIKNKCYLLICHQFDKNIYTNTKMCQITRRKAVIPCLVIVAVSLTVLYKRASVIPAPYIINWTLTDTILCHYVTEGDALPAIEDMEPPPDSIFFHETSCRRGLNSRQACAVESAARLHPKRTVHVLFNSPISEIVLENSCLAKLAQFDNVKLFRLHTTEYTNNTALGEMFAHRDNNRSHWRIEHTADMLRYVTMYKYGGVYLDTDMLVIRPLDALGRNWAAREDDSLVNVAAMAIGKDELGHRLVATILEAIKADYRPDLWVHNGPGAMNRVLVKFCNTSEISKLSAANCHGFQIYNPEVIYPIHYGSAKRYFEPGDLPKDEKAYCHHLWNRLSHDFVVQKGSPYEKLARQYCPTTWQMFGDRFGS